MNENNNKRNFLPVQMVNVNMTAKGMSMRRFAGE